MPMNLPRILVLDDDTSWVNQVPFILEDQCEVVGCATIDEGLAAVESQFFDIVLLDLNFADDTRSGLDVFRLIQSLDRGIDVIIISAETNPARLIEIFNAGASQFLAKPTQIEDVRNAVSRTLEQREIRFRSLRLANEGSRSSGPVLVGSSAPMQHLRQEIARAVVNGSKDILLWGETGTGKEIVARSIAMQSDHSGRFIPIHCGAISEGLVESELFGHMKGAFTGAIQDKIGAFEAAGGGYVFLDEIGEMPLTQQAKLLRVLQERKVQRVGTHNEIAVSFRCIAATHVDLEDAVRKKKFREDLYYRAARTLIRIPPLRERLEDVPELAHAFLASVPEHRRKIFTNEAIALLEAYSWPGNVRQLLNTVESLASRCTDNVIRERDVCQVIPELATVLPSTVSHSFVAKYGAKIVDTERKRFQRALNRSNGNRSQAAQILGLSRATFFRKARSLGLVRDYKQKYTHAEDLAMISSESNTSGSTPAQQVSPNNSQN